MVCAGLTPPVDVESYGSGDGECAAARRLLRRAPDDPGPRFAEYVVGDGEYATASHIHHRGGRTAGRGAPQGDPALAGNHR